MLMPLKLPNPIRIITRTAARVSWDITRESAASILTYELYPLGLVAKSLPTFPTLNLKTFGTRNTPTKKNKKAAKRIPILFIHGVFHNRSAFASLKQKLYMKGYRHFKEVDLYTSIYPIPRLAEQVASEARQLMKKYQSEQIDVVAHSMGGVIARYFVQLLGGDGLVRNLITLGTPHRGTEWSRYSVLPHIRELQPQSQTLERLNQCPPPSFSRAIAISGDLDIMMRPKDCTWWEGVRNFHLSRVGHAGLLFSKRVFEIIFAHLESNELV